MIGLTDMRGETIYVAREAIAVIRPVVTKETDPQGRTAVMLISGQAMFVAETVEQVLAKIGKMP